MENYIINDGRTIYHRITKAKARKLWQKQRIAMCPVNLRPGFPFAPHCEFLPDIESDFDSMVKEFTHYNCTDSETGSYLAFYIMEYKD